VDVVYVASVHSDHAASARLCLEAGKAVLVEKPMTVTSAEAAALVRLARDRGLFVMEAVWNRCNPLLRQAAELVAVGEVGSVRHVEATLGFAFEGEATHRLLDPAQAGGAILDLGVYPVHAAALFLGEPARLTAAGDHASTGVDAHAAALLTYPATADRPLATASLACSLSATLPNRLEVLGTRGALRIDNFVKPTEMTLVRSGGGDETFITQLPGAGYTFEAQEVMRCLRAGEIQSPLVPWADTLGCLRTLDRWRAELNGGVAEGEV
ncbi:MAG: Gfo/Idh/MocA family protein, partial [Actinomycetes bacterium]